jgi:hypothetical protein
MFSGDEFWEMKKMSPIHVATALQPAIANGTR